MKTHDTILSEARTLGRHAEQTLAESGASRRLAMISVPAPGRPNLRWIEASRSQAGMEYRLMELDPRSAQPNPEVSLLTSDNVADVLEEGYQLEEAERLAFELTPFAEADGGALGDDDHVFDVIADVVGIDLLSPAARLRQRAEIASFLEGTLEPNDFIRAVIDRQLRREALREHVEERAVERMTVDAT